MLSYEKEGLSPEVLTVDDILDTCEKSEKKRFAWDIQADVGAEQGLNVDSPSATERQVAWST